MRKTLIGAALAAVLAVSGCGDSASPAASASAGAASGNLTVLAAASLTESFNRIGKDFEAANPGVKVTFSYGGSSGLAQQIIAGAPADVFAAASPATMKTVTEAGDAAGEPRTFVRNQLVIAVAKGNPKGIRTLADLTRPGLKVALCAEQVPCGSAAAKALAAAPVEITPVTLEQDVKSALSKVKLGEVDAALVYRTDAKAAAGDVEGIEFPESAGAVNDYPIVALKNAPDPAAAAAFVTFVRSGPALDVLVDAGFQKP
ncbi:molybdate ABC transporter substrate-binding protein [Paractinoplanes ferrugineus]|uniref:Molybdate-binding protein n=1 Tax=Paractinoplanes ferrugineus TaxID=113564 RepID=A0A919MPC6_9ACTN|nr:molybdate ABC transporter substrate-binding protein [Actinoplanes ferrugineus]GIE15167.1 molybdate-binding protein [Actinoplanes ferrugineus]